jgi:hypothetical protein
MATNAHPAGTLLPPPVLLVLAPPPVDAVVLAPPCPFEAAREPLLPVQAANVATTALIKRESPDPPRGTLVFYR